MAGDLRRVWLRARGDREREGGGREDGPSDPAVIMMSGVGTFELVVEAMKLGAESFLQKPFDYNALKLTLANVQRMQVRQRELAALRRGGVEAEKLPGISPSIQQLNDTLAQIA